MGKEKVLDKIRKLLAMARHDNGNDTEQETALRMANRLMAEHAIEEAEIDMATIERDGVELGEQEVRPDGKAPGNGYRVYRSCPGYASVLALGVGRFCDAIVRRKSGQYGEVLFFAGERSDVSFAVWLFGHLIAEINTAQRFSGWTKRGEAGAFRNAASGTLQRRLVTLAHERRAMYERARAESGSRALAVVDRKASMIAERYGVQRTSSSTHRVTSSSYGAREAGQSAGSRINIPGNRPIGTGQGRISYS